MGLRLLFVSMHTSPADAPGAGDAGGMNVVELSQAQALADLGHHVDLVTRRSAPGQPDVTELGAGVQVDTWSLTGSGPEFGEVGQVGVHKGHAVRLLAEHLGATASDLVGFGDARSDIELLRACGTGVAMGQAPDELKAVATFVTRPVDEDGLAHAFDHLGLTGPLTPSR